MQGIVQFATQRVKGGTLQSQPDWLAIEAPLEISLAFDGEEANPFMMAMRTPGNDEELVRGLLYNEGLINNTQDCTSLVFQNSNKAVVRLKGSRPSHLHTRNTITTSACGACSKPDLEQLHLSIAPVPLISEFNASVVQALPEQLKRNQPVFDATGGVHTVALFDNSGALLISRSDVGRHNALDKLVGHSLAAGQLPLVRHLLLLSGRASFELVQKAARAGIELVAAIGAPSSMAAQLAQELGITLIGFLKSESFNVYSHPQRIKI